MGPTAVGKTDTSFEIAGHGFEIVSADSVQVYRHLDIGSGKPTPRERDKVPHHCIDIADPDYPFTAGDFCRYAKEACSEIQGRGRIPLFVGGTGLYVDSFFDGLSDIPAVPREVRVDLERELEEEGLGSLYDKLAEADPVFAGSIHRNDRQRIFRGLEVFRGTGEPLSSYFGGRKGHGSEKTVYVGLTADSDELKARIGERVDRMVQAGFFDEVVALRSMGYSPGLKSMKSIGYHEINRFLDGASGLSETIDAIKRNTKQYARRQMTWFRKNGRIRWFHFSERRDLINYIKKAL